MITLDETIADERTKADKARESEALFLRDDLIWNAKEEHRLAEEHEQLAEWLEELKAYREIGTVEECRNSVLDIERAYKKAIDDFVNACKENIMCQTFGLMECDIEQVAEQLKEGESE